MNSEYKLKDTILISNDKIHNKTFKFNAKDFIFSFVTNLGLAIENYYLKSNIMKLFFDGFKKKKITLFLITKRSGVFKILIFPWKNIIQLDNEIFKYKTGYSNKFSKILNDIIIKYNNIISIHIYADIIDFQNIKSIDIL